MKKSQFSESQIIAILKEGDAGVRVVAVFGAALAHHAIVFTNRRANPAKLNDHNSRCYVKDVLARLPTEPNSRNDELLPHCWVQVGANS